MDKGELTAIVPLMVLTLLIGVYPAPILAIINTSMVTLVNHMGALLQVAQTMPWPFG